MAAAPADFRPRERVRGKIKKEGRSELTVELVANPDVVARLGACKRADQVVLGFALESVADDEAMANARAKIERKRLDAIVLNGPSNLGADRASAAIIRADGHVAARLADVPKALLAEKILDEVERLAAEKPRAI
jgi:phosphopantothenoylcysteine decarboxylase/phosphopantothenate--cysteine ligase